MDKLELIPTNEPLSHRVAESVRGVAAGVNAAKVVGAAGTLFEAGGKHVLSESAKQAVRTAAHAGAARALTAASEPLFAPVAMLGKAPVAALTEGAAATTVKAAAKTLGRTAATAAAKEIAKGAGKAAGIGFAVDGAVATVEAVMAVKKGTLDKKAAVKHVAKEATTGGLATGAGVLLGAGLVALTGGVAAPVVFAVSALGAIGTKRILRRVVG